MTTQKAVLPSPELRRAQLSPRYRRNYTQAGGPIISDILPTKKASEHLLIL
ncbi:hypothetical protein SAMN04488523_11288 [Sulfitobacter brevis]|uniref:Uncharacterized protein n=1 Tax=Sulfitobacter brevis TaxID=74348 RepID=A0A1I2EK13_9RHOB|nr:hypothetical protein SAMN04488523_11288 [Sulfitobacter brevis]